VNKAILTAMNALIHTKWCWDRRHKQYCRLEIADWRLKALAVTVESQVGQFEICNLK